MKKMISLVLLMSFIFMGCASSPRHDHKTCPHKRKHHKMEGKNVGSEASEPDSSFDNDNATSKASGFGTDSGEPTQK